MFEKVYKAATKDSNLFLQIRNFRHNKKPNENVRLFICNNSLAGMEGFEPPNAGTRTQCLTTWRHPNTAYSTVNLRYRQVLRFWSWDRYSFTRVNARTGQRLTTWRHPNRCVISGNLPSIPFTRPLLKRCARRLSRGGTRQLRLRSSGSFCCRDPGR